MKLELSLDNGKVIGNGSIIMRPDQIFNFNFSDYNLNYNLKFLKVSDTNEMKFGLSKNADGQNEIWLQNHDLNLYGGNGNKLFEVGSVGDKKLFFNYITQYHEPIGHYVVNYVWILE